MYSAETNPDQLRFEATKRLQDAVNKYTQKKAKRKRTTVVENEDFLFDRDNFIRETTHYIVNKQVLDPKEIASMIYHNLFSKADMGIAPKAIRDTLEQVFNQEMIDILDNQRKYIENKMLKETAWEGVKKPTSFKMFCTTVASLVKFAFHKVAELFRSTKAKNVVYAISEKIEDEKLWAEATETALLDKAFKNAEKVSALNEKGIDSKKEQQATEHFVKAIAKMAKHIDEFNAKKAEEERKRIENPGFLTRASNKLKSLGHKLRGKGTKVVEGNHTSPPPSAPPLDEDKGQSRS